MRCAFLILFCACQPTAPLSPWNGVWLSEGGEGVVIYGLSDGGLSFSPRQLSTLDGRMVLTQRCADFDVSPQGAVSLGEGRLSGGTVVERDGGIALTFGFASEIALNANALTLADGLLTFQLSATATPSELTLLEEWADAGRVARTTMRRVAISKQTACR